ncbi:LysR family transcriptional regulator [Gordonia sp. 'Campus']|uniref:LysR family transcriptional regulator n=1 Tax=Gordonia sp. 'Campus' TaxID=2915824 RepID=UPI0027E1715F|nr:LysR family transcriptional regulator [Gordonia sp. 'Campus']
MLDVSLRELEYVVALHDERNFTRAARHLHMAQPALSQAIIRLERRLGVSLFNRTSRSVVPTSAGNALAEDARGIIDQVRVAVARATASSTQRAITVHVSEPALETPRRVMAELRAALPNLSVHMTAMPVFADPEQAPQLSLTIGHPQRQPGYGHIVLRAERVGALMSTKHALSQRRSVVADDLERHLVVSIDAQHSQWNRWIERWAASHGRCPRWTTSAVFGIVAGSDVAADGASLFVCLESVATDVENSLTWRPLAPTVSASWYLNWSHAHADSPELQDCISAILSHAELYGWVDDGVSTGQ